MQTAEVDLGGRRRAASSAVMALALTGLGLGVAYWMQAMQIHRVGPPKGFDVAALQWALFEPPAPSPPPPMPKSMVAVVDDDEASSRSPSRPAGRSEPESAEAPTASTDPADSAPGDVVPGDAAMRVPGTIPGVGVGEGGGVPGIGSGRLPGCVGPHCNGGIAKPGTPHTAPPKPVPLSALACRACPDPAPKALARTQTALTTKRGGTHVTSFCVDDTGRPYKIRTQRSFGDSTVDAVAMETVRRWRFSPMRVDGETRKVCSSVSFHIEFR